MLDIVDDIVRRHKGGGIVVDANVLTIFLLGLFDRELISQFKRTSAYSAQDFDLLHTIFSQFERLVVTPSVLAEAVNLCGYVSGSKRDELFIMLAAILPVPPFTEQLVPLPEVTSASGFVRLGFADATIEMLAASGLPVITADVNLYVHLCLKGVDAINFSQLRLIMLAVH